MSADAVLAAHARGEVSAEVALARLLLLGTVPDPATLPPPLAALAAAHAARLPALAALARAGFDPGEGVGGSAALFDRLAEVAPEAAVAFYSLGDPALLARATAELVGVIRAWVPVVGTRALDWGCGIGRVANALADAGADVVGVDVSAGMVAQARMRGGDRPGVRFLHADGGPLPLADGTLDLVVAADSLPFLVRAGAAPLDRQFADFARLLRPGGDLLVFNWSYRDDDAADGGEAALLADRHGFRLARAGERPFRLWDGTAWQLTRR